jgi:hypothetical protein
MLPVVLGQLDIYMVLLYGPDNCTIALLQQPAALKNDLEIAKYYCLESLGSPEAVRALGMWSFNLVFNMFSRLFLDKFVLGK